MGQAKPVDNKPLGASDLVNFHSWEFNEVGKCFFPHCKVRHKCSTCGCVHPSVSCPKSGMLRKGGWGKKCGGHGGGGGQPPLGGKSTHKVT